MKLLTDIRKLARRDRYVAAIGVFDGVHRAHRKIISSLVQLARRTGAKSVVLTFWPHPQGKASINSLAHRLRLIGELGADICVVIKFSRSFSRLSAADFIKNILVKILNPEAVFVGENFRFGKKAEGDVRFLQEMSRIYGFRLRVFKVFKAGNSVISSTLIRGLIAAGKIKQAERFLMHPVSVLGTVIRGESLAAKLGFPTANLDPHHEVLPPSGIYAVRVILGNNIYRGICYIGRRPTFRINKKSIEVHIFSFKKDIYGRDIEVLFIRKIRPEKKFSTSQALIKQIKKDIIKAKTVLSRP
jgi:riboflavin kinase / FMN adenylyltransferase